jgi:hypothetical protein
MVKKLLWAGLALILVGVALGFVKSGECGSVFQPRDEIAASVSQLLGSSVADCSTALDLTIPVWILIGAGVVGLVGAVVVWGVQNERASTFGHSH